MSYAGDQESRVGIGASGHTEEAAGVTAILTQTETREGTEGTVEAGGYGISRSLLMGYWLIENAFIVELCENVLITGRARHAGEASHCSHSGARRGEETQDDGYAQDTQ